MEGGTYVSIWILGGDARSRFTAEFFLKNGYDVKTYGVPQMPNLPMPQKFSTVILPFPSFSGALLRGQSAIPIEEVIDRLQENTKIFGGMLESQKERFLKCGAKVYDLYDTEPLSTNNAVPTAEGAICLAIEHSDITLGGARCLVCGFGRCGSALAQRLRAIGAKVTVAVRENLLARSMGFDTQKIGACCTDFDFIFNTVPAPIFTGRENFADDCVFVELASAPGAFAEGAEKPRHYHNAPGLPGKFAPKTAGILYAKSILEILESEGSI